MIQFKCPHCDRTLETLKQRYVGRCQFIEYNTTDLVSIAQDCDEDDDINDAIYGGEYDTTRDDTDYDDFDGQDTYVSCPFCDKDIEAPDLIEYSRKNKLNKKTFINFLLKKK